MDPTPKAVDLSVYEEKMKDKKFTVSVKKGESLKEVIKKIQDSNSDYIIIDKVENDIKFDLQHKKTHLGTMQMQRCDWLRILFGLHCL